MGNDAHMIHDNLRLQTTYTLSCLRIAKGSCNTKHYSD